MNFNINSKQEPVHVLTKKQRYRRNKKLRKNNTVIPNNNPYNYNTNHPIPFDKLTEYLSHVTEKPNKHKAYVMKMTEEGGKINKNVCERELDKVDSSNKIYISRAMPIYGADGQLYVLACRNEQGEEQIFMNPIVAAEMAKHYGSDVQRKLLNKFRTLKP